MSLFRFATATASVSASAIVISRTAPMTISSRGSRIVTSIAIAPIIRRRRRGTLIRTTREPFPATLPIRRMSAAVIAPGIGSSVTAPERRGGMLLRMTSDAAAAGGGGIVRNLRGVSHYGGGGGEMTMTQCHFGCGATPIRGGVGGQGGGCFRRRRRNRWHAIGRRRKGRSVHHPGRAVSATRSFVRRHRRESASPNPRHQRGIFRRENLHGELHRVQLPQEQFAHGFEGHGIDVARWRQGVGMRVGRIHPVIGGSTVNVVAIRRGETASSSSDSSKRHALRSASSVKGTRWRQVRMGMIRRRQDVVAVEMPSLLRRRVVHAPTRGHGGRRQGRFLHGGGGRQIHLAVGMKSLRRGEGAASLLVVGNEADVRQGRDGRLAGGLGKVVIRKAGERAALAVMRRRMRMRQAVGVAVGWVGQGGVAGVRGWRE
mmetsp:Transcript_6545/g.13121  ORF Transcript_6545/g.13121 Transcript_6545/m.13121 type:complete len:430 (+) Transcript_6545:91-1380(+)